MRRMTRRKLIGSVVFASLAPEQIGFAQRSSINVTVDAARFAQMHTDVVNDIALALKGLRMVTPDGFSKLLELLRQHDIVSRDDIETLQKLRDAIYAATDVAMKSALDEAGRMAAKAREVVQVIVQIAQRSYNYAREHVDGPTVVRITAVVAADVSGAMSGAIVGAKFGNPAFTAIAAVAGAAGVSSRAYLDVMASAPERGRGV